MSAPPRSFGDAVTTCFVKYATFTGRASRSEYWFFTLFTFLVSVILLAVVAELNFLATLGTLLPSLAVFVRRMHDTDRSGWWFVIGFVPLVGIIVLIVLLCLPGVDGPTRFDERGTGAADRPTSPPHTKTPGTPPPPPPGTPPPPPPVSLGW